MIQDVKPVIIEQSGTDSNGMPFPLAVVVNQDMVVRRNQDNKIIGDQKDNQADKRLRIQNEQDAGKKRKNVFVAVLISAQIVIVNY